MIFHFHTYNIGSTMVGSDHIPRVGEKLRLPKMGHFIDDRFTGIFLIEDVIYSAPSDPGHQRVDVYGKKASEGMEDLSYSSWMAERLYRR